MCVVQLCGWEVVVLDGIAGSEHPGVLKAWNLAHGSQLGLFGKGGRKSIEVCFYRVFAFWFNKDLVAVLVCKPVKGTIDLVT